MAAPPERSRLTHYLQFAVFGVLMHFAVSLIALPMALLSARAATAITAPIMARISAYSAAEAPRSSRSKLDKVFIGRPLIRGPPPARLGPTGKSRARGGGTRISDTGGKVGT